MPSAWVRIFFTERVCYKLGMEFSKHRAMGLWDMEEPAFIQGLKVRVSQPVSYVSFESLTLWKHIITRLSQILKQAILLIHLTKSIKTL